MFAAGHIHTRIASQPQRILQRHHAKAGNGIGGGANHRPVDAVVTWAQVRFHLLTFVFGCVRLPPADQRVVVVRAGVYDLLGGESVRQMGVRANIAKAKLQHGHAGNFEAFAQGIYVGRDVSEILGEEREPAQGLAQLQE